MIVILLGSLKLIHNAWRLRKYTAAAEQKAAAVQDIMKDMPQDVRRGRANGVPFGVRAIQSGIEVDGVWVSNTNTPASSVHGSPELRPSLCPPEFDTTKIRRSSSAEMPGMDLTPPHLKTPPNLHSSQK